MRTTHPAAAKYVKSLSAGLSAASPADCADIVREIEDHITDATTAGRPLDEVLTSLGPAEELARAYLVELALNPPRQQLGLADRALTVLGLLAVASLPSLLIVVVLGAVGVALTAAGLAVLVAGIAAMFRPDLVPDLTVQPWVCVVAGPALVAPGVAAFVALYWYGRFLVNITRRTLARVRA